MGEQLISAPASVCICNIVLCTSAGKEEDRIVGEQLISAAASAAAATAKPRPKCQNFLELVFSSSNSLDIS